MSSQTGPNNNLPSVPREDFCRRILFAALTVFIRSPTCRPSHAGHHPTQGARPAPWSFGTCNLCTSDLCASLSKAATSSALGEIPGLCSSRRYAIARTR